MNDQGAGAAASPGETAGEWQDRVIDTVEDVITALHDRVIRPVLVVIRVIVFGSIVASMALVVSVLFSVAVVRLLDVYAFGGRVWASDAVVGGLLAAVAAVLWTRRRDTGTS